MYDNPEFAINPRTRGVNSVVIWAYFPAKPNNCICLVPVIASVNDTSILGFVSKLSERLQHAAFLSSALEIIVFSLGSFKSITVASASIFISMLGN